MLLLRMQTLLLLVVAKSSQAWTGEPRTWPCRVSHAHSRATYCLLPVGPVCAGCSEINEGFHGASDCPAVLEMADLCHVRHPLVQGERPSISAIAVPTEVLCRLKYTSPLVLMEIIMR